MGGNVLMDRQRKIFIGKTVAILAVVPVLIYAHQAGPDPGHAGVPGESTCNTSGCHTGHARLTPEEAASRSMRAAAPIRREWRSKSASRSMTRSSADGASSLPRDRQTIRQRRQELLRGRPMASHRLSAVPWRNLRTRFIRVQRVEHRLRSNTSSTPWRAQRSPPLAPVSHGRSIGRPLRTPPEISFSMPRAMPLTAVWTSSEIISTPPL